MATAITQDPDCGMELAVESAAHAYEYVGWIYLFCGKECLEIFKRPPLDCVLCFAHSRSGHLGYACE